MLTLIMSFMMSTPAHAIQQIAYSTDYSCRQLQATVQAHGQVVIWSNRDQYGLFVSDRSYCALQDRVFLGYVKSKDMAKCQAGFICKDPK